MLCSIGFNLTVQFAVYHTPYKTCLVETSVTTRIYKRSLRLFNVGCYIFCIVCEETVAMSEA